MLTRDFARASPPARKAAPLFKFLSTWPQRRLAGRFLRFAGVSGCGWLADLAILALLVRFAGLGAGQANVISALCAATGVFLVVRERIFEGAGGRTPVRLTVYLAYIAAQIALASAAIAALAVPLQALAQALGLADAQVAAALGAKIAVTPVLLVCNFLVAGRLNAAATPETAHA
jgi:putative flippase GtrA